MANVRYFFACFGLMNWKDYGIEQRLNQSELISCVSQLVGSDACKKSICFSVELFIQRFLQCINRTAGIAVMILVFDVQKV